MPATRIFCEQVEPHWQNGALSRLEKQVDIWKIGVHEFNLIPENVLSKDELLKASRFLHLKDRASFVSRRAALRILLGRYSGISPSEIEFIAGKNKKPELRSESNIRFNVSHSGELILIAISDSEIGFNYSDILKHSFSTEEISCIEQAAKSRELFFRLWTRKEALTKASSKGLDDDLRGIPCLDGWHSVREELIGLNGSWRLNSFNIEPEYIGSIACQAESKLNFLYFEF